MESNLQREKRLEKERLRSAARREKRKQDLVAYEEYLVKERERNRLRKDNRVEPKFKSVNNLTDIELSARRSEQNEWTRNSRARQSATTRCTDNDSSDFPTIESASNLPSTFRAYAQIDPQLEGNEINNNKPDFSAKTAEVVQAAKQKSRKK